MSADGKCVYTGARVHLVEYGVIVAADIFGVEPKPMDRDGWPLLNPYYVYIIRYNPKSATFVTSEQAEEKATHQCYVGNSETNWLREDLGVAVVTHGSLTGEIK